MAPEYFGCAKRKTVRPLVQRASAQEKGATVFGYWVKDPERFGVIDFDETGKALGLFRLRVLCLVTVR